MVHRFWFYAKIFTILTVASAAEPPGTYNSEVSFWCDEAALKDISQRIELLTIANEHMRLKVDTNELKFHTALSAKTDEILKQLFALKETLDNQNAYLGNYSNLIDVRSSATCVQSERITITTPSPPTTTTTTTNSPITTTTTKPTTKLPTNCAEALQAGDQSGIYQLHLPDLKPFYAYCLEDPDNGAAWNIIQRRQDGTINFQRDWAEYRQGFGHLNGEFWLGLEKVHALTQTQLHELWIQMEDFDGVIQYAKYDSFAIGDEAGKYALNVLGKFSGTAGNSLVGHEGQKFTTKDADNDNWNMNCASQFTGAWWYNACHKSNLNGQYLKGKYGNEKFAQGINWHSWHGHHYSLKYVHMAIRPVN